MRNTKLNSEERRGEGGLRGGGQAQNPPHTYAVLENAPKIVPIRHCDHTN